jgi:two-component system, NarL family, sensor kinase
MGSGTENLIISLVIFGTITMLLFVVALVYMILYHRRSLLFNQMERDLTAQRHRREMDRHESLAQERERQRIARDLHDEIGSALVNTRRHLMSMSEGLSGDEKRRLEQMAHQMHETMNGLHRIISELTPPSLDVLHLTEALRFYAHQVSEATGLRIALDTDASTSRTLASEVQLALYRTLQEIINNTVKHAQCQCMDIIWEETDEVLTITTYDNGVGFDASGTHTGHGLHNIRNRVALCGGTLTITSSPGHGTQHTIVVPSPEKPIKTTP